MRDNRGYFANQIETFEAIETTVRLPCYQALLGCAKHLSPVVFVVDATLIVFQKVVTDPKLSKLRIENIGTMS